MQTVRKEAGKILGGPRQGSEEYCYRHDIGRGWGTVARHIE